MTSFNTLGWMDSILLIACAGKYRSVLCEKLTSLDCVKELVICICCDIEVKYCVALYFKINKADKNKTVVKDSRYLKDVFAAIVILF